MLALSSASTISHIHADVLSICRDCQLALMVNMMQDFETDLVLSGLEAKHPNVRASLKILTDRFWTIDKALLANLLGVADGKVEDVIQARDLLIYHGIMLSFCHSSIYCCSACNLSRILTLAKLLLSRPRTSHKL